jgi:hypothetical protein
MKRFIFILRICVPLVILMALILPGCSDIISFVGVSSYTVIVGEKVELYVWREEVGGCSREGRSKVPGYRFQWSVEPSNGATVNGGVFIANKPGTYIVSAIEGGKSNIKPATIEVQGTADETTAAETTAAETTAAETTAVETTSGETTTAVELFNNGNGHGVQGGGTAPTFELASTTQITEITTYHYTNNTSGAGTISLKGEDGKIYGPFQATGSAGQGGVANAYWTVEPKDLILSPGRYTIIDSDPNSFSQNDESGGVGMAWLSGIPQK